MTDQPRKRGRPRQDACKNGHPLSGDNLYVAPSGERQCCTWRRACHEAWRKANPERWREIRNAAKRRTTARRAAAKENANDQPIS
jgi:hypothetical protein